MVIKTGVDIVFNKRFEKLFGNKEFLEKVFHASELKEQRKIIGIFALKEAVIKAIGKKIDWKDILIKHNNGKPIIELINEYSDRVAEGSISHDGEYTIAFVVIESGSNNNKQPK